MFDPSSSDEEINDEEGPIADAAAVLPAPAAPVLPFVPGLRPNVTITEPADEIVCQGGRQDRSRVGHNPRGNRRRTTASRSCPDAVPP